MSQPADRTWLGEYITDALVSLPTPPATVLLLSTAISYPVDAAVTPYAGCGRVFDGASEATLGYRYIGQMVAPGAVHAQGAMTRCVGIGSWVSYGPGFPPYNNLSWTTTGGTTGADIVTVPADDIPGQMNSWMWNREFYFGCQGATQIVVTSDQIADAPSVTTNRRYELQTLAHPYVESMHVTLVAGYSFFVTQRIGDLDNL